MPKVRILSSQPRLPALQKRPLSAYTEEEKQTGRAILDTSASKPGHRRFFLLLFGLSLAAYGRLLLQPGVFGDDPQLLYAFHRFGLAGYRDALGYSRPFGGWVYTLLYPLAGGQPLAWQFCALLLRSAGAGLLFDLLRRLGRDGARRLCGRPCCACSTRVSASRRTPCNSRCIGQPCAPRWVRRS
jgi:hypothetical protein